MPPSDPAECPLDRRRSDKWHFNRDVSVVDILTILSAVVGVFYAYTTLDKRLEIVEKTFSTTSAIDLRLAQLRNDTRTDVQGVRNEIRSELRDIKTQLNTLLERSYEIHPKGSRQ